MWKIKVGLLEAICSQLHVSNTSNDCRRFPLTTGAPAVFVAISKLKHSVRRSSHYDHLGANSMIAGFLQLRRIRQLPSTPGGSKATALEAIAL